MDDESGAVPIDETTPVLIVGGGLTGLSAALFLAWRGCGRCRSSSTQIR